MLYTFYVYLNYSNCMCNTIYHQNIVQTQASSNYDTFRDWNKMYLMSINNQNTVNILTVSMIKDDAAQSIFMDEQ